MDERLKLQAAYARARGLKNSIPREGSQPGSIARDMNEIVAGIAASLGDLARSFTMPIEFTWVSNGKLWCDVTVVHSKLGQFISYLEEMFQVNARIVEIGSLFNSIKDEELKSRCSDLLSAPGNFDRVINQATQVLEDRIRKKAKIDKPLTGVPLVNAVLVGDLAKTILQTSENAEEHEGICHICRGLMLSFRNPTHHHLLDKYSREDALKLCAFIDNLLRLIDNATVRSAR